MQQGYKTFTAHVNTKTLLDDFAPPFLAEIAEKFEPIQRLEAEYAALALRYAREFDAFQGYEAAAELFRNSAAQTKQTFEDFKQRMHYFTLVFFGAVSAGKTSMICDLINMTPQQLTALFADQPGFEPHKDQVAIGANVTTINLYEALIESSAVRLVDVPGIGGVVHDNNSLAPFVDMADCIIFLFNSHNTIMANDYQFIYKHVAMVGREAGQAPEGGSGFTAETGLDKKILVVFNQWHDRYPDDQDPIAKNEWEERCEFVLNGNAGMGFKGISGLFRKPPVMVRANTTKRDRDGERLPGQDRAMRLEEFVAALRDTLQDEGASLRLNRPRQILLREFGRVLEQLELQKTNASMDALSNELAAAGVKAEGSIYEVMGKMEPRIAGLAEAIGSDLSPQLKRIIWQWKPKVTLAEQGKGVVPEWFPGAKGRGLGKSALQENLRIRWEAELRVLIKQQVNFEHVKTMIESEMQTLSSLIENAFRIELSHLDPRVLERFKGKAVAEGMDANATPDQVLKYLQREIDKVVQRVQNELVNDLVAIIITDIITDVLLHALLTPVGALFVALIRRWIVGGQRQKTIQEQVERGVDSAVREATVEIRTAMTARVREMIETTVDGIKSILGEEQEALGRPRQRLDAAITDIVRIQKQVAA